MNRTVAETRRLARLHTAFERVCVRHAAGATYVSELRRLRARRLKRPFASYALSTLWCLFLRWRRDPRPETLARRYKPGRPRRLSARDQREVLRALRASPNLSIKAVVVALNHDRPRAERFSLRAAYRMLQSRLPARWTTLRRARLAAQLEVDRIDALLADDAPSSTPRARAGASS